jgi:hypothetical protein
MATTDKDFKVKNGLSVTLGGTFGGTVTVATPTLGTHATTKDYVDNLFDTVIVPVESSAPLSATNGELYFDSVEQRLFVYYNSTWNPIAFVIDTTELPQHIHDTAIDGTGLVVSIFKDAGLVTESAGDFEDAGSYNTNSWVYLWDGGIATDNFN